MIVNSLMVVLVLVMFLAGNQGTDGKGEGEEEGLNRVQRDVIVCLPHRPNPCPLHPNQIQIKRLQHTPRPHTPRTRASYI